MVGLGVLVFIAAGWLLWTGLIGQVNNRDHD